MSFCVAGCGQKRVIPPKETPLQLAGKKAGFRDWSSIDPCTVQPRILRDDFEAMTALIDAWLEQTKGDTSRSWKTDEIALYEEGARVLPGAMSAQTKTIGEASRCGEVPREVFDASAKKLEAAINQASARIGESGTLIPALKHQQAVATWKAAQLEALTAAKGEWCAGKPAPGKVPDIYFASEDEKGVTEWHFCDDSKVAQPAGAKPEYVAPVTVDDPGKKPPKRADPKKYVEAAAKYPITEVQHAPKPGEEPKTAPPADQGETPPVPDKG